MARALNLMGVGFAPAQALAIGGTTNNGTALAGAGTTQSAATVINGSPDYLQGSTAVSQTGFLIPTLNVGESFYFCSATATSAVLYPPTGGTINELGANTGVTVAQQKPALVTCIAQNKFLVIIGA